MKKIEIDDHLYEFLLRRAERFNETPTDIIWRELKKAGASGANTSPNNEYSDAQSGAISAGALDVGLVEFIESREFAEKRDAKEQFIAILSWIARKNPKSFAGSAVSAMNLRGRTRKYLSTSKIELEEAGRSVNAHKLPGTEYWVVTNNDTSRKKDVLAGALRALGCGPETIRSVCNAIGRVPKTRSMH